MTWQIGDRALCIDDKPQEGDPLNMVPCVAGITYTVTKVLNEPGTGDRCKIGLRFQELQPVCGRIGFCADRFEKVPA